LLTADLVHARRRKGVLKLVALDADRRARALSLAEQLVDVAHANVGQSRGELLEAWGAVRVSARDRKLADGLKKLIDDRLEFEVAVDVDPVALRREVFERATRARKALGPGERFDRDALIAEAAEALGVAPEAVLGGLFGDLKSEHRLTEVKCPPASALVEGYDLEQARAVMLRATKVTARIEGASPDAVRGLFRKLRFRRLLFRLEREGAALRLDIDGPLSLFDSVTKYGLGLALALPAITECGRWSVEADVRWGKQRTPVRFELSGEPRAAGRPARMRDEVQELVDKWGQRDSPFTVAPADDVLDLPGVGLCVPDLAFTHVDSGEVVLFEALGFWSREAVWRRVELVEAGLPQKILFAVSSRLRVSEQVLDDEGAGALYVYKGVMSCKQIEDRLLALLG
jgi:uncharacterized protein